MLKCVQISWHQYCKMIKKKIKKVKTGYIP